MKHIWRCLWILALLMGLSACGQGNQTAGIESPAPVTQSPPVASPSFHAQSATPASNKAITTTQPAVPTPVLITVTPMQTPACWQQGGRYEYGSLQNDLLQLPLEFAVYLPPCYDIENDRHYPVLYLIHGQSFDHDQWDRLGVDEVADSLMATGELAPFMVVLPRDRSWAQPAEDRFGEALVASLLGYIDSTYRTLPDRSYRSIGGLSRGAAWAVHLGLTHWELFGAVGAHSLPVFWSDAPKIKDWLDAIPLGSHPRIYLDIGENDRPEILESATWFEKLLTEKNIPHQWHLFSGYHEEAYWSAHVEQYLRWYAQDW